MLNVKNGLFFPWMKTCSVSSIRILRQKKPADDSSCCCFTHYYYFVNYFLDHRLRWHVFDGPLRLPGTFFLINSLFLQGIRFFYEDFFEKTPITSSNSTLRSCGSLRKPFVLLIPLRSIKILNIVIPSFSR